MRDAPPHPTPPPSRRTALTLVAAQSIQPLPLGSMFISTSPSTRSGKMSCRDRETGLVGRGRVQGAPVFPPGKRTVQFWPCPSHGRLLGSEGKAALCKGFKVPLITKCLQLGTCLGAPSSCPSSSSSPRGTFQNPFIWNLCLYHCFSAPLIYL